MFYWLPFVSAIRFFRWQATPQQSISLIPPTAETVYISNGPTSAVNNVSQATGCPLQAYVSRNMSHAFWPAINGTDHCDIQGFCQNRTASLYCYRVNATDACWPVMVVACPSGLVLTCAEGFVCDDGSLPWWRDQSRRNPMALPVCRSIWEADGMYDGSLLRNQTCPVMPRNSTVTDALGPSGVLAPSWATCIVTPTIISTCQAIPVPTRLSACNMTVSFSVSSAIGVGGGAVGGANSGCITTISASPQTSAVYYGSATTSACYYGPPTSCSCPSEMSSYAPASSSYASSSYASAYVLSSSTYAPSNALSYASSMTSAYTTPMTSAYASPMTSAYASPMTSAYASYVPSYEASPYSPSYE